MKEASKLQVLTGASPTNELVRSTAAPAASAKELHDRFHRGSGYVYHRFGSNPTVSGAERALAELEGAERSVLFPSGMAAVATLFFAARRAGIRRLLLQHQAFDQTVKLAAQLHRWGDMVVEAVDPEALGGALRGLDGEPALLYLESPSNPMIVVADLQGIAREFREACPDGWLAVDSTLAPPVVQRPVALGVDVSLHSMTKYLYGHADHMGGAVSTSAAIAERLRAAQVLLGTVATPESAWLLTRSLKTLGVRMATIDRSADAVARFLASHSEVLEVRHPSLMFERFPFLSSQMSGGGGLLSFVLAGGLERARRFCDGLALIEIATSFGGTSSVVEVPVDIDWKDQGETRLPGLLTLPRELIRLSIGLEAQEDLIADLAQAIDVSASP